MRKRIYQKGCICILVVMLLMLPTACGLQSDSGGNDVGQGGNTLSESGNGKKDQTEVNEEVSVDEQIDSSASDWKTAYQSFFENSTSLVLSKCSETNPMEDAYIYSPVNFYLCLAMLAEMTANDTHDQIYSNLYAPLAMCQSEVSDTDATEEAIREKHLQTLRSYHQKLYQAITSKHCSLGNSIWLNDQITFREKVIQNIEKYYYGESTAGQMGSKTFDRKIQDWLNEQTKNKLADQVSGIHTSVRDALLLYSVIYFEDQWEIPFEESATETETFYGAAYNTCGTISEEEQTETVECDFLHGNFMAGTVITKQYQEVSIPMNENYLHIILPQEGYGVSDLLDEESGISLLDLCNSDAEEREYREIEFSMPKLDIESVIHLESAMEEMGMKDVLESETADFSPFTEMENTFYVGQATQTSRMQLDENGCSVASYTEMEVKCGAVMSDEIVQMQCDHPFLFMITNGDGLPLFVGVVNRIEQQKLG